MKIKLIISIYFIIGTSLAICLGKATFSPSERCVAPLYREYVHLRWTWTGRRHFSVSLLAWNFPLLRFSENGWRGLGSGGIEASESRRKPPSYIQGNQAPFQRLFHKLLSSFSWKTPKGHPLRILRRGFFLWLYRRGKNEPQRDWKKKIFRGLKALSADIFQTAYFFHHSQPSVINGHIRFSV